MTEQTARDVGIDNHLEPLSVWLDLFRWLAAFAVLVFHERHRLFENFYLVPSQDRSVLYYLVGLVSSFGPPAVIIFFVLSGFLVGGSSLRRYRREGSFDAWDYFIARLTRLWVVLIPVFLLTYCLNTLSVRWLNGSIVGIYGPAPAVGSVLTAQGWPTFLCNTAFLQTAACYQYGGNGALWSLFNEFWYYVAWPFIMIAIWSRTSLVRRTASAGVAIGGLGLLAWFQFVGPNILIYFSLWILGLLAADYRGLLLKSVRLSVILVIASLVLWRVFSRSEVQGTNLFYEYPFDLLIALSFANLIMAMKSVENLTFPPARHIHASMAGFSFTLYCIHSPLLNFCAAFLMKTIGRGWHMQPKGLSNFSIYGVTALFCLGFAYALSLVTERHTGRLRKAIAKMIGWQRVAISGGRGI